MVIAALPLSVSGTFRTWSDWLTMSVHEAKKAVQFGSSRQGAVRCRPKAFVAVFGRLDALIDAQVLQTHELLLKYKKTILVAIAEVDDAIKGYRAARRRLKDIQTAIAESHHALDLASGRYERGLTEFLNVVDAERELYAKEDERIVAQEAVALQFVLLYKALGGGWERYDLLPPIREPEPAIVAMFRRVSNQWQ
jgi:Outer membrane efflux protein